MARHPNHCYLLFECTYEIMFFFVFFLKFWNEEKCSLAKQAGLCPSFWLLDELEGGGGNCPPLPPMSYAYVSGPDLVRYAQGRLSTNKKVFLKKKKFAPTLSRKMLD